MHNKLLIRKLATEGLKMRRIKKVKCASPGQEQKKIGLRVKYTPEIGFNLLKFI